MKAAGYREVAHTADFELAVWGPDLEALLVQAALGMYAHSQVVLAAGPRQDVEFSFPNTDPESLLVDFLSELLFYAEDEGLGFVSFDIDMDGDVCRCHLMGMPIESQGKEIKAVTYHGMKVERQGDGLGVNIVFDV